MMQLDRTGGEMKYLSNGLEQERKSEEELIHRLNMQAAADLHIHSQLPWHHHPG